MIEHLSHLSLEFLQCDLCSDHPQFLLAPPQSEVSLPLGFSELCFVKRSDFSACQTH